MKELLLILLMFMFSFFSYAEKNLILQLEKIATIGKKDLKFASIAAVCEDDEANFYVLDHRAFKVYKFSPRGKMLLHFGQKGEGPGDLTRPYSLFISIDGKIIVGESRNIVSIFNNQGKFIKKYNFASKVGDPRYLKYAGKDLFYVRTRNIEGKSRQVILNSKGQIINSSLFSEPNILASTRKLLYSYSSTEYTPFLIFNYYKNYSIAALSNEYKILIVNDRGKIIRKISRDIPRQKIKPIEKEIFIKEIKDIDFFPGNVKRDYIARIPEFKNYLHNIFISSKYIFAFRIKNDVSNKKSLIPVDIFKLSGKYLGVLEIEKVPFFISDRFIYSRDTSDEEDLILIKYSYKLTGNSLIQLVQNNPASTIEKRTEKGDRQEWLNDESLPEW